MDKYEERRLQLLQLVNGMGRGGRVRVAQAIGKSPDYIARMLYPRDKAGHKGIGEDSADLLDKAFPGWRKPASPFMVQETPGAWRVEPPSWPFVAISPAEWRSIPPAQRDSLEAYIRTLVPVQQATEKAA
jgi:hypothetical protein